VRLLGSDLSNAAIEPLKPDTLKEGDAVVLKVQQAGSSSSAGSAGSRSQSRNLGGGMGPPPFGR
jgi:exosome complex RNA-binding protein Rrp4